VPEGLLAARIVPGASITEFERSSDCVEGAVGLWPQAASSGIMERRGDNFIQAPVRNMLTNDLRGLPHWLSTRGQPRVHFRGPRRRGLPDIRRMYAYLHR
jgi:hypothetical protein